MKGEDPEGLTTLAVHMEKKEGCPANDRRHYRLDAGKTLRECLEGKRVVEPPAARHSAAGGRGKVQGARRVTSPGVRVELRLSKTFNSRDYATATTLTTDVVPTFWMTTTWSPLLSSPWPCPARTPR